MGLTGEIIKSVTQLVKGVAEKSGTNLNRQDAEDAEMKANLPIILPRKMRTTRTRIRAGVQARDVRREARGIK